jgi:hypothetical protein
VTTGSATAPTGLPRDDRPNGTKANPCLHADILGDWREEVIWRTRDNRELRIFTTTIPTRRRRYALIHDPIYRLSVAWQNVAYNQPTQPGFYMGDRPVPESSTDLRIHRVMVYGGRDAAVEFRASRLERRYGRPDVRG